MKNNEILICTLNMKRQELFSSSRSVEKRQTSDILLINGTFVECKYDVLIASSDDSLSPEWPTEIH